MERLLERIVSDPKVLGGKPIIRGTRLSVERILSLLEVGVSETDIFADFPMLRTEDIRACIAYARHVVAQEDVYPACSHSTGEKS